MVAHGWPKLIGGPELWAQLGGAMKFLGIDAVPPVWGLLAAVIETLGGTLLAFGLLFRPAALALLGVMIVAAVMRYHVGHGEFLEWAHPAEMGIVFASLVILGPGRFSLDRG